MKGALFLGWRYLAHHRFKTAVLLASVTLMMFLPAATRLLVADSAKALTARAETTPLLIGARGSQLELVLNALYFHAERPPEVSHQLLDEVQKTGLATAIPLNTRFQTRGAPIVGTNLDYFKFRQLMLSDEGAITANASLVQYNEITTENVREFHFHGDTSGFPLIAVIAIPPNDKSSTLLRGRFQEGTLSGQLVIPASVLGDLLETVFTVQNYIILGLVMLSLATIAVIILVFLLSQQLRRGEFFTLKRMGASRGFIAVLVASELGFVFLGSLVMAALLTWGARSYATQFLLSLMTL